MSLTFTAEKHEYKSLDGIDWLSVTGLVGYFKQPFNAEVQAAKSVKNKKSKWYGLSAEEVKLLWTNEAKRATDMGTWYHDQREKDIMEFETIFKYGLTLPIIRPIYENNIKVAPDQNLTNGIYPEHFVYLKSAGLCGQSDKVEVANGKVYVSDYKTNKELKMAGYTDWSGVTQKMSEPVSHLDDCHFMHYALQLSIYMYIILKHNPNLKPGDMILDHVIFEEESRDKYDYPIYKKGSDGNFIVKEVKQHKVPYLKSEVISLINYLRDNKENIKAKKH